ncbi:MAG TPA: site-2 protease family protein [Candidatus Limnocylindria bacterium]|nr:site-2 protease family protein [Candidatus Limnocylindria bacterium]
MSEVPGIFESTRRSFRRGVFARCPTCRVKAVEARYRWKFRWIFIRAGLGLSFVFGIGGLLKGVGWLLLNWFLLDLFMMPLIWLHELGHAWAGRLLGLRVFKINLGVGKTILTKRILGVETVFHAIPISGNAWGALQNGSWSRVRSFGFTLGGPAVHVLLVAAVLLCIPFGQLWQWEPFRTGLAPVAVFFYANVLLLAWSLFPRGAERASATDYSDGNLLAEAFFKKPDPELIEATRCLMEAVVLVEAGKLTEALSWLDRGLTRSSESLNLLSQRTHCLYELRRWEEAREEQLKLLARNDLPTESRAYLLNSIAYTDAILDREELLPEADRCSLEAMPSLGWHAGVKGTRGTVLMLLGRMDEGMPLLRESLEQTEEPEGKAENSCWLAMGYARLGELTEARKHVEEARRLAPDCILLARAEREVSLSVQLRTGEQASEPVSQ